MRKNFGFENIKKGGKMKIYPLKIHFNTSKTFFINEKLTKYFKISNIIGEKARVREFENIKKGYGNIFQFTKS